MSALRFARATKRSWAMKFPTNSKTTGVTSEPSKNIRCCGCCRSCRSAGSYCGNFVRNTQFVMKRQANRLPPYGTGLHENLVDSEVRKLVREELARLEACGGRVVAEVGDEIIVEVP